MAESAFAKHVVSSIRNELELLKTHNYIQPHAYDEILRLLPSNIGASSRDMPTSYPPPPSSTPSYMSTPGMPAATPATVIPPPSYNASANEEKKLGTAEALYDYTGENPNTDLSFRAGETIQLTELVNDDWWKGSLNGRTGIFPRSYVKRNEPVEREKYTSPPPPPRQNDSYGGYSPIPPKRDSYNNYPPPPPQQTPSYDAAPAPSYGQQYNNNNYQPYPSPQQQQQYPAPPQQQMAPYNNAPPALQSTSSAPAVVEQHHEENKAPGFGSRMATKLGDAAVLGFGATVGGNIANSIF